MAVETPDHNISLLIRESRHWGMGEFFHSLNIDNYKDKISILSFLEHRAITNEREFAEIQIEKWADYCRIVVEVEHATDPRLRTIKHETLQDFYTHINYDQKLKLFDEPEKIKTK